MEKELAVNIDTPVAGQQRGFILVTALIMLSLLTLLSLGMYMSSRSATQTSASAQRTTEAYYYAETAINYISWAMRNDAEFDSFDFRGVPVNDANAVNPAIFLPLTTPVNSANVGDWSELMANLTNPGPTTISDTTTPSGISGQVMYFDNTPIVQRAISWPKAATKTNQPVLNNISTKLPRYIRLDIDAAGVVTPSIPALPHATKPVIGDDIPNNGAVVWLTAGNSTEDFQVFPCTGTVPSGVSACDKNNKQLWSTSPPGKVRYGIVVYAIGYVNGRPSHLLRAVIF